MQVINREGTRKRWAIAGLVIIGLGAAAAQFIPLIEASSRHVRVGIAPEGVTLLSGKPISGYMGSISSAGVPPINVVNSIAIPADSRAIGSDNYDKQSGTYDRALIFHTDSGGISVQAFFQAVFHRHGWKYKGAFSTSSGTSTQILAQIAGNDGFYWEVGVTFPPDSNSSTTSASKSHFLPTSTAPLGTRGTSFEVRLQMTSDQF